MDKRKNFGYITTKVYGGKAENKTIGIHFNRNSNKEVIKFARGILQAVEYGKDIDITIFKYKPLKNGTTRITITSPK